MGDWKKKEEEFKRKYGYLIINHPIEYGLIYFLVFFGAISLVQDGFFKLGFKVSTYGWYKYLFCAMVTSLNFYYWRKIAKRDFSQTEK